MQRQRPCVMTSRSPQNEQPVLSGPLDAYIRLSPDAVLAVDTRGQVRAANALAGELFGYDPAELTGLTLEALLPERFRMVHAAYRESYGQAPRHRRMGTGLDLWGRRKDGSEFPVDVSLAPLPQAGGDLVVAAVRDMTQRRREQAAEAALAAIVTSSGDAIFAVTADGMIASWNPSAETLLGYQPQQITGRPAAVIVPEERRPEFATAMKRAGSGDHVERFGTWCARQDGSEVEAEVTVSAVRDRAGRLAGMAVVLRDLTERRRAEAEAGRALRQEEELLMITDRERIARDLHDRAIQRLFAAGLTLQGTAGAAGPAAAQRIYSVVDELDAAIKEAADDLRAGARPPGGWPAGRDRRPGYGLGWATRPSAQHRPPRAHRHRDQQRGSRPSSCRAARGAVQRGPPRPRPCHPHRPGRHTGRVGAAGQRRRRRDERRNPAQRPGPPPAAGAGTGRFVHHRPVIRWRHPAGVACPTPVLTAARLPTRGQPGARPVRLQAEMFHRRDHALSLDPGD
jgi:PAS domain S-box-containing protein